MKLGIISGTHGEVTAWQQAMAGPFQAVELILHAGDILYHGPRNAMGAGYGPATLAEAINASTIPVIFSRGNCDSPVDQLVLDYPIQAPYALVQIEGLRIWLQHGDELTSEQMVAQARRYGVAVCIFGHSHIPLLTLKEDILLFNPGSPSLPKNGLPPTVGLLDPERREASLIDLASNTPLQQERF